MNAEPANDGEVEMTGTDNKSHWGYDRGKKREETTGQHLLFWKCLHPWGLTLRLKLRDTMKMHQKDFQVSKPSAPEIPAVEIYLK